MISGSETSTLTSRSIALLIRGGSAEVINIFIQESPRSFAACLLHIAQEDFPEFLFFKDRFWTSRVGRARYVVIRHI